MKARWVVPSAHGRCGATAIRRFTHRLDRSTQRSIDNGVFVDELSAQRRPQQLLYELRVRLAARRLHHLPDEEAEDPVLAGAELSGLRRDGVYQRPDTPTVSRTWTVRHRPPGARRRS